MDTDLHQVTISMVNEPASELNPGAFTTVKVRVSCDSACNLTGQIVKIVDQDGELLKETKLIIPNGAAFGTDPVVLKAPTTPGKYIWSVIYPEQAKDGILHQQVEFTFSLNVRPEHPTNIVVWDADSPVVADSKFKVKVGVKCSAGCALADKIIKIINQQQEIAGTELLGKDPLPETESLYWTEVELQAPKQEGYYTWSVKFPESTRDAQHLESTSAFSFTVVNRPECILSLEVKDKETGKAVNNASVILHPYRAKTDENGEAKLAVTQGKYQLFVTRDDKYELYQKSIEVSSDFKLKVELSVRPPTIEYG